MKSNANTETEVRTSVASIYASLLSRQEEAKREKRQKKEEEKQYEGKEKDQEEKKEEEIIKMTRKERKAAAIANWQGVISDLTGDDLDYEDAKPKKKKYKKWIDDENPNASQPSKPKKKKKKNYNKEFENEVHMLKNILADQNRFTLELYKRYQNAAGPNTKDSIPLNKNMIELAATINSSRKNSLDYLNAIANLKKAAADLSMKQYKMEQDGIGGGSSGFDARDTALVGSRIAAAMMGSSPQMSSEESSYVPPSGYTPPFGAGAPNQGMQQVPTFSEENFDPSSWGSGLEVDAHIKYENTPHEVVVLMDPDNKDSARFAAFNTATGEEIPDYPVPNLDSKRISINEQSMQARTPLDEVYPLRYNKGA